MLEIRNISKTFNPDTSNAVYALRDVSLTVNQGSFTIVIGTNGSGKSTLLNAVAGSFFVDDGTIWLDKKNVTRWPEHKRASLIGRVFQNPFSGTAPNMSVEENLSMAAERGKTRGLGYGLRPSVRARLRDHIAQLNMGLENRMGNIIGSLSGGQRQAITLLMATLESPKLLLLDEHTAALDPKSADQTIRITQEVVSRGKLTTLMVTHSMHQAVTLGDRLIMMDQGRILLDISGEEKQKLQPTDLLERFENLRTMEAVAG
jgi:putative ABC transport system ATP-binding protein